MELNALTREEALTYLRVTYTDWDVWYVQLHPRGTAWCARPKGTPVATHRAYTAGELEADLREAEAS